MTRSIKKKVNGEKRRTVFFLIELVLGVLESRTVIYPKSSNSV